MTGSIPFDRVAGTYDETRGGLDRGRRLARILAELLPERARLLEVGVGTGAVAAGLTELGRTVVGVDLRCRCSRSPASGCPAEWPRPTRCGCRSPPAR